MADIRHLVVVLGDQLDLQASAFDGFEAACDRVWMAEVAEESEHVWSSQPRIVIFLAAMRHFAEALRAAGRPLDYRRLDDSAPTLADELAAALQRHRPQAVVMTAPGDWRVLQAIRRTCAAAGLTLDLRDDRHLFATVRDFAAHAQGRRQLRLEAFYRAMRRRHRLLMEGEDGDLPAGGRWNFDADNRQAFGAGGPGEVPPPARFEPDAITREVVAAAEAAWREGRAPLPAVEGFVRQILGWREYVRGVYWTQMPDYAQRNALGAHEDLPGWYWTGDTDMACLRDALGQTLEHGYAHHIQRLMVTGLFALLYGVEPQQVHRWYLAVYVDAVEWVELPNTLGMSQYADGLTADGSPAPHGPMANKPCVATGQFIARMGNACAGCRYKPAKRTGDDACPFTTLYWDFLLRHEARLAANPRMALQVKNLARLAADERRAVAARAAAIRAGSIGR